jgi:hypothetical protein
MGSLVCFLGSAGSCGRPLDLNCMLDVTWDLILILMGS